MGIVKVGVSNDANLSKDYFRLRGRLMTIEAEADHRDVSDDLAKFREEAYKSLKQGGLTESSYEELMQRVDKAPSQTQASEEYVRLKDTYRLRTANGRVMNSAEREDFNSEIDLALKAGMLTQEETERLRSLPASNFPPTDTRVIDISKRRSARDTPMRRKAAARRAEHTNRYDELVTSYKELYKTCDGVDNSGRVRKFFREVEQAYKSGDISLAEYKDFHAAMNDTEAFLNDVDINVNSGDYETLREQIIASVSSDDAIREICKQVSTWATKHGVSEAYAKQNPLAVALNNFNEFLNAGGQLVALGDQTAMSSRQLQLMRL